ncbi:MAG: triphosphoribosyl-dephospho-CoA synthase [Candidatus Izemoplasmataceae bacterium]
MKRLNITQKDIKKKILEAKDEKKVFLESLNDPFTMFTLKVNQPFYPKNTHETTFLIKLFNHLIHQVFKIESTVFKPSFSGDYYVYFTDIPPLILKKMTSYLEEHHPLGRLVDLDVYQSSKALSRTKPRTCYLCEADAHYCARSQNHKPYEIKTYITQQIQTFIINALTAEATNALRKEVYLTPKFGLVSAKDSGAHLDMDLNLFLTSINAITPFFKMFTKTAFEKTFEMLRIIGIQAEEAMFQATNQVNTHKGAIFIFGSILPALAHAIYYQKPLDNMLEFMHDYLHPLIKDDFKALNYKEGLTAGEIMYERYGTKGIRGEVLNKFPSIFSWYHNHYDSHYEKLCAIMAHLEDTTIIKRFNFQTLKTVQNDMRDLLKEKPFNLSYYHSLSSKYKALGISPGGSADLLGLTFLFEASLHLLPQ